MRLGFLSVFFAIAMSSQGSLLAAPAFAAKKSKNIAKAVKVFEPLAESGVDTFTVRPSKKAKDMLKALAIKSSQVEDAADFDSNWTDDTNTAWGADEMAWAETTMKDAYEYVTTLDETRKEWLDQEGNEREKAKTLADIKKAKEAFSLLQKTGVMFGIVPMGAVQCGVTFAALAIIDPNSGKIYVFAKEGSGC